MWETEMMFCNWYIACSFEMVRVRTRTTETSVVADWTLPSLVFVVNKHIHTHMFSVGWYEISEHAILKPTKCTLIILDVIYYNIRRIIKHVSIPSGIIIRDSCKSMNYTNRTNDICTVRVVNNINFINVKQAKEINQYKNVRVKLHKSNAAIWHNNMCRQLQLTPKYISIKVNGSNRQRHTYIYR
jgi:hypothetical protein